MDLGSYRFLHPYFWLIALLLPIGIWIAWRRVPRGTLRFSSLAPFQSIRPSLRVRLRGVVPLLRLLAVCALITAMCRPQHGTQLTPERSRGIGIMLVVDNSGSMATDDFELNQRTVTRIEAVRKVAQEFVQGDDELPGRPDDEIGLVSFTGYPIPRAPLTLDHGAVLQVLKTIDVIDPDSLPRNDRRFAMEETSTATGDAIALAASRLRDAEVKSKVMILLSDGKQTYGVLKPEDGANIAETFGVKIYTIGIGQAGVVMRTENHPFFGQIKRRVRSDLDEASLTRVAEITGGKYFNAATTGALRDVYKEIDQLERTELETTRFYRWDEKFAPIALAGLICLVLEIFLAQTIFRRIP